MLPLPSTPPNNDRTAHPPTNVWIPNHPQPTNARSNDGNLAPVTPNALRINTGNGAPYFVPICAEAIIGKVISRLARKTHDAAWPMVAPNVAKDAANLHAGMQTTSPIQRPHKSYAVQLLWCLGTGSRSVGTVFAFAGAFVSITSLKPNGSGSRNGVGDSG